MADAAEVVVFAAGSLRAPLIDIGQKFERQNGDKVTFTFGPSGVLRDRIAGGERADVFASANMDHPQSLDALGWTTNVDRFARNTMCILAAPSVKVSTQTALDVMLDPAVNLGTSTPNADPSGDYAWQIFKNADAVRPGAFTALTAKARQLVGGPQSPIPPSNRNPYGALLSSGEADVFLTYCTNAELARKEQPSLRIVKLPEALAVGADYGIAARRDRPAAARAFVAFVLAPEGQRVLHDYGFDPP